MRHIGIIQLPRSEEILRCAQDDKHLRACVRRLPCFAGLLTVACLLALSAVPARAQPATLPATRPATQPAEWEKIDQQWQTSHRLRHVKAFWLGDSEQLQKAEDFFDHFRELCLSGRSREAVQGALPSNQTTDPALRQFVPEGFAPFNPNLMGRIIEIHLNLRALRQDLGDDDYEYLGCLYWMSFAYRECGDYGDAEAAEHWATEACDTLGRILQGRAHPFYATCLDELASDKIMLSKFDEAEHLLDHSLKVAIDSVGRNDLLCARIQNDLGTLYLITVRYPQAIEAYQRARRLIEAVPAGQIDAADEAMHARLLENLGMLAEMQGDYDRARQWLWQALDLCDAIQARFGHTDALRRAECLMAIGALPLAQPGATTAELDEAEKQLTEAKAVFEKQLGVEHPATARVWMLLASVLIARGDAARGDTQAGVQLFRAAMNVYERAKDRNEGDRVSRLMGLIGMCIGAGDYQQALIHAREGLEVSRAVYGQSPPQVAPMLEYLGQIQEQLGQLDDAEKNLRTALDLVRGNMDLSFAAQTEDEQLRMTQMYRTYVDGWLSFHLRHGSADAKMWVQVLSWKGTVFARQHAIREARRGATEQVLALFKNLEDDTRQLQGLTYENAANPAPDPQREARIAKLRQQTEELEETLARKSAAFAEQRTLADAVPADVQRLLPPGAALVDFLRYDDVHPPLGGKGLWPSEERYVAFVVTAAGVTAVQLGPAAPIDQALQRWQSNELFPLDEGLKLRAMVWEKLEPALGDARLVLISPDGPLAMLPFAALPGDKSGTSYLIEHVALATVPVPQLLPSLLSGQRMPLPGGASALLVGAVDFDAAANAIPPGAIASSAPVPSALALRGSTDGHWQPLPGAADEIRQVIGVFQKDAPGVRTEPLEGQQADKADFIASIKGKQYLHVATHAFFAAAGIHSIIAPAGAGAVRQTAPPGRMPAGIDPGLLSGLVLAGANRPLRFDPASKPLADDGILTALEVSELDLRNLRVVALSACETALGKTAGGEGVLGLQRAFQLAGARTVLASLWKVDDRKTCQLMTDFYKGLLARHEPPVIALREAQLRALSGATSLAGDRRGFVQGGPGPALSASGKLSPAFWAAWVLSGDPGDLDATLDRLRHGNGTPPAGSAPLESPSIVAKQKPFWLAGIFGLAALAVLAAGVGIRRRRR